jgi:hypothetical protein
MRFTVFVSALVAQEMFNRLGKALDRDLDDVVPMLLKKVR